MNEANVVRLPVAMKRGPKVRKGPIAQIASFPQHIVQRAKIRAAWQEVMAAQSDSEIKAATERFFAIARAMPEFEAERRAVIGGLLDWSFCHHVLVCKAPEDWEVFKGRRLGDRIDMRAIEIVENRYNYESSKYSRD